MKDTKKRIIIKRVCIVAFLAIASVLCVFMVKSAFGVVLRQGPPASATHGGDPQNVPCKSGNCYHVSKRGAFWIYMEHPGDDLDPASILNKVISGEHLYNCETLGGAYLLVTPLSQYGVGGLINSDWLRANFAGGEAAAMDVSHAAGVALPPGAVAVDYATAYKAFDDYKELHLQYDGHMWSGTRLAGFCAKPGEGSPPPGPDEVNRIDCTGAKNRVKGTTLTRIAVENITLDGFTNDPYNNSWQLQPSSPRGELKTDSGYSDGGDSVETLAKPGDSVHFLHEVCMLDRYVRMATTLDNQDKEVSTSNAKSGNSHQNDSEKYYPKIPNQSFTIESTDKKYLFGDGIEVVNGQADNVSLFKDIFTNTTDAISVTDDRYGIGTLSPSIGNEDYECNDVYGGFPEFPTAVNLNPFAPGGFQIPGFSEGTCTASQKTTNNHVGKTIVQKHVFDSLKVWEKYSHERENDCGCGESNKYARHIKNKESNDYGSGISNDNYDGWRTKNEYKCEVSGGCGECLHHEDVVTKRDPITHDPIEICDGCGECDSWAEIEYGFTSPSYYFKYKTLYKNDAGTTKTATIHVPYNFKTSVTSGIESLDEEGLVYQASKVKPIFSWSIDPRQNDKIGSYATVTPSTTVVRACEFYLDPTADAVEYVHKDIGMGPSSILSGGFVHQDSSYNPCNHFGGTKTRVLKNDKGDDIGTGYQNPKGRYGGEAYSTQLVRNVDDDGEYVGYKYCVAVGIWPADSHDDMYNSANEMWQQKQGGLGGAMDAGEYWNISNASCVTIAKKPNFQVWNGSVYTNGGITTSVSKKDGVGIFGSWSDYAIVAGGEVKGMSSGAKLGYNNSKYNFGLSGGQPKGTNLQQISEMTISNNKADSIGSSGVNAMSSIETNLERMYARYRDKAESLAKQLNTDMKRKSIVTTNTGFQFVYANGGTINISSLELDHTNSFSSNPNYSTIKNTSPLVKGLGDGKNDNTLVIYVKGDLRIDTNICLSMGSNNCEGDATKLRTYNDISTNSTSKLPQILIFANNITITENVTRIDAWLIANNGTVNTCEGFALNGSDSTVNTGTNPILKTSDSKCYKTLVVNGPVYAKDLKLYRNAGNYHGGGTEDSSNVLDRSLGGLGQQSDSNKGSISPAEIFNMRSDVYLWAYSQAERSTEAVVTYTRELAPRY